MRALSLLIDGERAKRAFIGAYSQQTGDDGPVQGQ